SFAGVFDLSTQSLWMFGGDLGQPLSCGLSGGSPSAETWRFDIRCKRFIQPTSTMSPPARTGAAVAHEGLPVQTTRMILFGGRGTQGLLGDLWALDFASSQWSPLTVTGTPPEPRENATLVFNGSND